MGKYKTVNATEETFKAFEELAKAYGLTNTALLTAMVEYFKVTKIDPRSPKNEDIGSLIKAMDKRLVSFIKEQEKKILLPTKEAVFEMAKDEGPAKRNDLRIVNANVKKIIKHLNIE